MKRFLATLRARNKEFLRDRAALTWNLLLPFLIVVGFAFAFTGGADDLYKVGVYDGDDGGTRPDNAFFATAHIDFIPVTDRADGRLKVERHQLDMLIDLEHDRYWLNTLSNRGYMLERVLDGTAPDAYERATVSGREIRYVDWLVPGVLGMNMMFSALYGVGYVIVRYRKNGMLRRLKATPLSAFEFLAAQVVSRLWLILVMSTAVFVGTDLLVGFPMHGSYLALLAVFACGALALVSLGLIASARLASEEMAEGILNMLAWPMMFLSGVWFSLEGLHPLLQDAALALPLTHVTEAARAVMIDGAGLLDIADHLGILLAMGVVFLALGARLFKWE